VSEEIVGGLTAHTLAMTHSETAEAFIYSKRGRNTSGRVPPFARPLLSVCAAVVARLREWGTGRYIEASFQERKWWGDAGVVYDRSVWITVGAVW